MIGFCDWRVSSLRCRDDKIVGMDCVEWDCVEWDCVECVT
jgi:hypothetical protein